MVRKYREEIHANEIVLLAYYIAAINIEAVYHGIVGGEYVPFEGICLTDTFQMYERDDLIAHYMPDNSERRQRQKAQDIRVIVGNPPYSAGQRRANDNAANVPYPGLDGRIRDTYGGGSRAVLRRKLYDSYIRAIRWGTDRLGDAGVMAYVSGSGWVERGFADGMRKRLAKEFSSVHVFHLRGDVRKDMLSKGRTGEGANVFAQGSMTGVAISVFVKNPESSEHGRILFHDIGDKLDRDTKLKLIRRFGSVSGISTRNGWTRVSPDEHGDWLQQRDRTFDAYIRMGDKKEKVHPKVFRNYSLGISTNRDAWCYNASKISLKHNMERMINVYNEYLSRRPSNGYVSAIEDYITSDATQISWSASLKKDLSTGEPLSLNEEVIVPSIYRPFNKEYLYFSRRLIERMGKIRSLFPSGQENNLLICVTGVGARAGFSCLMVDCPPNLHTLDSGQCFPLRLYEGATVDTAAAIDHLLESSVVKEQHALDGVTDVGEKHFQAAYHGESINKVDVFHYIYGLLHSEDYRTRFANNLSKELPRIPLVKKVEDFRAFRDAGRRLGELHVNYESVEPWPVTIKQGDLRLASIDDPEAFYRVTKMKFGGTGRDKDKTTVIYNANITMQDIPLEAYDYVVNGKPALEWVMERQVVKTDKASGIVNDANRYAIETVGNPAYPLELFQRVITVSIETMEIVRALPKLELAE